MIICQQDPVGRVLPEHKEETTYCFFYLRKKNRKNDPTPCFVYEKGLSNTSSIELKRVFVLFSAFFVCFSSLASTKHLQVKSALESSRRPVKSENLNEWSSLFKFHSPTWPQFIVLPPTSNADTHVHLHTHTHTLTKLTHYRNLCFGSLRDPGEWKITTCTTITNFQKNDNIIYKTLSSKVTLNLIFSAFWSFVGIWCYKKCSAWENTR